MSLWTILWISWGVYFAVLEGAALYHSGHATGKGVLDQRDTLSEHIWYWFGIQTVDREVTPAAKWWGRTRRAVLVLSLAWLTIHLTTGRI